MSARTAALTNGECRNPYSVEKMPRFISRLFPLTAFDGIRYSAVTNIRR